MLDASAFLRATQGNREAIDALRTHRYGKVHLSVPEYFYFEVANGLRNSVIRRQMVAVEAQSSLDGALALNVEVEKASALVAEALHFGLDHGISVYDAGYAVLALRLEASLVTADSGFSQAAQAAGIATKLLANEAAP